MIRALYLLIFDRRPATFVAAERATLRPLSPAASRFAALTSEGVSGEITPEKVVLCRYTAFFGNSFKPYFIGKFEDCGGQVVLRGAFQLHWRVRTFLSLWFGLVLLATVLVIVATFADPAQYWPGALGTVFMSVAGYVLLRVGRWFARNDEAILRKAIESAISNT